MPRFITDFPVNATDETIHYIVNDYLTREGFVYTNYNGEDVWKKGKGLMAAPQFIKVQYQNGQIHLEAWMKYALLPGVYCGEMGLTGFMGWGMKEILKGRVNTLIQALCQASAPVPEQPQV